MKNTPSEKTYAHFVGISDNSNYTTALHVSNSASLMIILKAYS